MFFACSTTSILMLLPIKGADLKLCLFKYSWIEAVESVISVMMTWRLGGVFSWSDQWIIAAHTRTKSKVWEHLLCILQEGERSLINIWWFLFRLDPKTVCPFNFFGNPVMPFCRIVINFSQSNIMNALFPVYPCCPFKKKCVAHVTDLLQNVFQIVRRSGEGFGI